jgi:hypothetical protein
MQNHRFFFLVMVVGTCCMHNLCAMELVKNDDKKKDVAINMQHFWSDDYTRNISSIQNLDLKKMRSGLKKEQFLPDHSDTLHHLLYLSTIRNNDNKTLFTYKQQGKFDTALQVKQSVPLFFGINGAVIIGTALFSFTNLAGLLQCSNATQTYCLSQTSTIMTPTVTSVAGILLGGFVSLYATGLSPDLSSRKADKVQDEIGHLNRKYATIAKYWIDIHFSCPEKAQYIANQFDAEAIKQRAQLKTHKTKVGNDLVNPLEEAWHFIKHNNILITFTEIENYLYNKIHSRHIESLEKIVREQSVEIERLKQKYEEK